MTRSDCSANWRPVMVLLAILIAISGVGGAAAQSGEAPSKPPAATDNESKKGAPAPGTIDAPEGQAPNNTAPSGGLKVVKDPDTGKLRGPDRAEAAKLGGPGANRSAEGLQLERLPNGATVIHLQGRFQSYSVATRNADGGIDLECRATGPEHDHAGHDGGAKQAGQSGPTMATDPAVISNGK